MLGDKIEAVTKLEVAIEMLKQELTGGHPDFIDLTIDELKLHNAKNADYARQGNALGNFYRVSDMLNSFGLKITPAQVAFIYMMKQVDAAGRMLFGDYEGAVEGKSKRLQDMSIYAKLTMILDKER